MATPGMNGKLRPISCLAGWSRGANRAIRRRNSGALKHFSERASCFERAPNAIFGQIMGRYCTQSYLADTDSAPRELVSCQIACYLVNRGNQILALAKNTLTACTRSDRRPAAAHCFELQRHGRGCAARTAHRRATAAQPAPQARGAGQRSRRQRRAPRRPPPTRARETPQRPARRGLRSRITLPTPDTGPGGPPVTWPVAQRATLAPTNNQKNHVKTFGGINICKKRLPGN